MIYFKNNEIVIRDMIQSDDQIITDEEIAQGWHQTVEKYEMRLQHQAQGKSVALIPAMMMTWCCIYLKNCAKCKLGYRGKIGNSP